MDMNNMDMDYLEMFDDCPDNLHEDGGAPCTALALNADRREGILDSSATFSALVPLDRPVTKTLTNVTSSSLVACSTRIRNEQSDWKPKVKTMFTLRKNPTAFSWYRHYCKQKKKNYVDEASVLDALVHLQMKIKTGKHRVHYNMKRLKRRDAKSDLRKHSLVLQSKLKIKSGVGNRYVRQYGMTDFLEVAFGERNVKNHFHLVGNIATHFHMDRGTVQIMRTTVAASVIAKQIMVGARILALCRANRPTFVAVRHAWDETAQDIQVKLADFDGARSAWKVMVQKLSMTVFWGETSLTMDFATGLPSGCRYVSMVYPKLRIENETIRESGNTKKGGCVCFNCKKSTEKFMVEL